MVAASKDVTPRPYNILVLTDEKTGCNNQAIGVANKIGGNISIVPADKALKQVNLNRQGANGPRVAWPDIIISASHGTEHAAEGLKNLARDKSFNIKLGPVHKRDYQYFDLIARYDPPVFQDSHTGDAHEKVMFTVGVAHRVTPEVIEEGKQLWENKFSKFGHPIIGVMLGGSTSGMTQFSKDMGARLGKDLNALAESTGGSVIVSTSRRTPHEAINALAHELKAPAYIHDWNKSQGNPHFGLMGIADYLISTGDSMSMIMEACSTGKPVYYYPVPEIEMPNHNYLQQKLTEKGCARAFDGKLERWTYTPPDVAGEIAAQAKSMMQERANLLAR